MRKVKKGDKVLVLAGKDRGKTGVVQRVISKKERVVVEGVNLVKKHVRPSRKYPKGGVITIPAPLHWSNVMVICPECNKPTRPRIEEKKEGKKVRRYRVCRRCGANLDRQEEKA